MNGPSLDVRPEVRESLPRVVALESTLITHGLPWPVNLETALAAQAAVRASGATPATIAVLAGQPTVGLTADELEALARHRQPAKLSERDLGVAVLRGQTGGTTVAATLALAHRAGVSVFATGGIGGVHRPLPAPSLRALPDVSADLFALTRYPLLVVCAGAKSILDLPATLELLESLGVLIAGYRTSEWPAFHLSSSQLPLAVRIDTPTEAYALYQAHRRLAAGAMLLAQPVAPEFALDPSEYAAALAQAEARAKADGIAGPRLTPYLLAQLAELTAGRSLSANRELIVANAALAGQIARLFATA